MVVKNEADRYLRQALSCLSLYVDELFIFDDQSTDNTLEICKEFTNNIIVRSDEVPSFVENESIFRGIGWLAMGEQLGLTNNDWVISLDADEMLCDPIKPVLEDARDCYALHILEVWDKNPWRVRADGYWKKNYNPRVCKYSTKLFRERPMGCGSIPFQKCSRLEDPKILHFGYLKPEDRIRKHKFYMQLENHGHNQKHIDSIISKYPKLQEYTGYIPDIWDNLSV